MLDDTLLDDTLLKLRNRTKDYLRESRKALLAGDLDRSLRYSRMAVETAQEFEDEIKYATD